MSSGPEAKRLRRIATATFDEAAYRRDPEGHFLEILATIRAAHRARVSTKSDGTDA